MKIPKKVRDLRDKIGAREITVGIVSSRGIRENQVTEEDTTENNTEIIASDFGKEDFRTANYFLKTVVTQTVVTNSVREIRKQKLVIFLGYSEIFSAKQKDLILYEVDFLAILTEEAILVSFEDSTGFRNFLMEIEEVIFKN